MTQSTAAVLVIDLQVGMFNGVFEPPIHDATNLVQRVRQVTDWARRTGRKVGYVRHDGGKGDPLAPGEPGWPVYPDNARRRFPSPWRSPSSPETMAFTPVA